MQFIAHIKRIPSREVRSAELLLFKGQARDAETLLLQTGHIYRAIKLNIRLFKWERALELALKKKTHVDTVIAFRQRYLTQIGKEETLKQFIENAVEYNWETIQLKIKQEKEKEAENAN